MRQVIFCIVLSTLIPGFGNAQEFDPRCDINEDGAVDSADLLLLQQNWHTSSWTPTPTPTLTPTVTASPTPLEEVTIDIPGLPADATPLILVRIPAGSFQMGAEDTGFGWSYPDEMPLHTVTIGYDFYLGKYEMTQAQYEAVMDFNPAYGYGVGNNYPAYRISWNDWHEFLTALNALVPGGGFRMPSEAEWEYACRAGTTTQFFFGDSTCDGVSCTPCDLGSYAWWCGNNDPDETKMVGLKLPNPFGLYDMHGNVHEFCQDQWHASYTGAPSDGSAWETGGLANTRMMRGGRHNYLALDARSAYRDYESQVDVFTEAGFRIVRDVQNPD